MDAQWEVIKSLIEMIDELKKDNERLRNERDAAKREMRNRIANAAPPMTTLRRPHTQPPAYTSFAIPPHAGQTADMEVEPQSDVIWILDDADE
ncbi:hypothetical protein ACHWQZ_G014739 [Mnemiopsis leidyi]